MRPFKAKRRKQKRKLLTFKSVAIGLFIFIMTVLCYKSINTENKEQVILKEETEYVR
tara:strand:+ start:453 stop:623 length:171 start_codon:yes stop_codon:yes gene_type:complete